MNESNGDMRRTMEILALAFRAVSLAMSALAIALVVLEMTRTAIIILAVGLFALTLAGFIAPSKWRR